jgi:hypothetical protein
MLDLSRERAIMQTMTTEKLEPLEVYLEFQSLDAETRADVLKLVAAIQKLNAKHRAIVKAEIEQLIAIRWNGKRALN